jgi:hypothetical protein
MRISANHQLGIVAHTNLLRLLAISLLMVFSRLSIAQSAVDTAEAVGLFKKRNYLT